MRLQDLYLLYWRATLTCFSTELLGLDFLALLQNHVDCVDQPRLVVFEPEIDESLINTPLLKLLQFSNRKKLRIYTSTSHQNNRLSLF
jgi:hypothetical protein